MIRRLSALAMGLACLIALAGCGSDSSSAGGSASPTQNFAGPKMPSQAQGASREAAQAFVGYWVETLNYATNTGNTKGLKTLGAKDCQACNAFAQTLDQIYGHGGHVASAGGWKIDSAVPFADEPKDEPAFKLALKLEPQKVYPTKNGKPKSYPGGDQSARIVLTRQDDHWLVERLDL